MFNKLFNRIRKKEIKKFDSFIEFETISLWTAGIKYESRIKNLMDCRIHEKVILERQPNNQIDNNAIHVKRKNSKSLGFIGMAKAKLLAPLLDDNNAAPIATIINLKCDSKKENYGVKLTIKIKPEYINMFISNVDDVDYNIELSSGNNLYLLIDCDEKTLTKVKKTLNNNDIDIQYSGISYKTSVNGKNYDWYIKLNSDENKDRIKSVLEKTFPSLKRKSDRKFNTEYLEMQDEQLDSLKKNNKHFELENIKLNKRLGRFQKIITQSESQFEKFSDLFLPNTLFIHDSQRVLTSEEIPDFSKALSILKKIEEDSNFKGKQIKTLDKWFDTHFNTGIRDDGRIYFKRENKKTTILVSLKKNQTSDIKLLKKHK